MSARSWGHSYSDITDNYMKQKWSWFVYIVEIIADFGNQYAQVLRIGLAPAHRLIWLCGIISWALIVRDFTTKKIRVEDVYSTYDWLIQSRPKSKIVYLWYDWSIIKTNSQVNYHINELVWTYISFCHSIENHIIWNWKGLRRLIQDRC